jgi:hypothetical protein
LWQRNLEITKMVYTNLCYKNPSVDIIVSKGNNYHSLRSNSTKINRGELLLLEHSISTDQPVNLVNVIHQNIELWEWLCPRESQFNQRTVEISTAKVSSNAFSKNSLYILGKYSSCMNHSCQPNACVIHTHLYGFLIPITFMATYALETIEPDQEIQIMYSSSVGHTPNEYHHFTCNCSLTDEERATTFQRIKEISTNSTENDSLFSAHRRRITEYVFNQTQTVDSLSNSPDVIQPTPSDTMKNTIVTQALALLGGVYKVSDQQLLPLERFHEYIANQYHVDPSHATDTEKMNCLIQMISDFEEKYDEFVRHLEFDWATS